MFRNLASIFISSAIIGFPFQAVAGCLLPFLSEAVILDVSIFLAVEAERSFLVCPGVARLVLALLVAGGARVEFLEPIFLVCPLFLAGNSLDDQLLFDRGGVLLFGDVDLGLFWP